MSRRAPKKPAPAIVKPSDYAKVVDGLLAEYEIGGLIWPTVKSRMVAPNRIETEIVMLLPVVEVS